MFISFNRLLFQINTLFIDPQSTSFRWHAVLPQKAKIQIPYTMKAAFTTIKSVINSPALHLDATLSNEWTDLCYQSFNATRVPKEWLDYHLWVDGTDMGPFKKVDDEALFKLGEQDGESRVILGSRVKITNNGEPIEWTFPPLDREVKVKGLDMILLLPAEAGVRCTPKNGNPYGVILMDSGPYSGGGIKCTRDDRSFAALNHVCSMTTGAYSMVKPTLGPQVSLHFTLEYGEKAAHEMKGVDFPPATDFSSIERTGKASEVILKQLDKFRRMQEYEHLCFLIKVPMYKDNMNSNNLDGFTRAVYLAAASSPYYRTDIHRAVMTNSKIHLIDYDEDPIELKNGVCVATGDYAYTPIGTVVVDDTPYTLRQVAVLVIKCIYKRPLED